MIDRKHIEKILKVNGLTPTAEDEEIRSILISAKWNKDDVETALTVLRENINTHDSRVDTLHNVFLTDRRLSPEAIQSLLGIDIEVSSNELASLRESRKRVSIWQIASVISCAVILAVGFVMMFMYTKHIGIFHPGL